MRIGVVSSTIFPLPPVGYSGLEFLAWQTAKGLAERGHQVVVYAPDGSTCPGCQAFHFGPAGQTDEKTAYSRYWQTLAQVDVIIDESWQKWTHAGRQEGWLKAPVLAVCHAPVNTMFQQLPPPGVLSFVCISEDQRAHFEALFGRPARTAYNGVDSEFYRPLEGLRRTDRFLFLARFSSIKGPDIAIKACLDAGVGLDLVGDTSITNEPDLYRECQRMASLESPGWDRAANGKQIRVVGPASRAECVWWFSQAHALLHPNERFREPFGLAPVEAMLCGCPVIAWDNGAMRETVVNRPGEFSGWVVSNYATLRETLRVVRGQGDHIAGASFDARVKCREWALQWSVARMCARYEELATEAVETGGW